MARTPSTKTAQRPSLGDYAHMTRLLLVLGMIVATSAAAAAQDCTTVPADRTLIAPTPPYNASPDSDSSGYGSAACDRFVVAIDHARATTRVETGVAAPAYPFDAATCQSAQMQLAVWGRASDDGDWVPLVDVARPGHWITHEPDGQPTVPSCGFGEGSRPWALPVFINENGWSHLRVAFGYRTKGTQAGPVGLVIY
jgi:hypothetical protein